MCRSYFELPLKRDGLGARRRRAVEESAATYDKRRSAGRRLKPPLLCLLVLSFRLAVAEVLLLPLASADVLRRRGSRFLLIKPA